jgi:hypothetical protein
MIHHIVCFRFVPGASGPRIAAAGAALVALRGVIPEIRDIRFGPNHGPSAAEYSHALTVVFDDMAAVVRYLAHPAHVRAVAEHLAPIREARLAIDLDA